MNTINYYANGEASDWMLHEKGIIAFSPELGSDEQHGENSQAFYVSRSSILPILRECFAPVDQIIARVRFLPVYE